MGKAFSGNQLDRLKGFEFLLFERNLKSMSLLDIGCNDGHIAYEFCRNGCSDIVGVDCRRSSTEFCERLFENIPGDYTFINGNINDFIYDDGRIIKPFDIVLLFGVYHEVLRVNSVDANELIKAVFSTANKYVAIRDINDGYKAYIPKNFVKVSSYPKKNDVGELNIYEQV